MISLNKGDEAKKQEEAIDNYCLHLGRFNISLSKQEEAIASSCLHVATGLEVNNTGSAVIKPGLKFGSFSKIDHNNIVGLKLSQKYSNVIII